MKSIVMPGTEQLTGTTKDQTRKLNDPENVKETLASLAGTKKEQPGSGGITVVDMWKRLRHRRLATEMIRRWNLN